VNLQPQINPLASSDVGGTAGHDAAACVSARGKCDGASACDARDANHMLPTTQSLLARQVVAPHERSACCTALQQQGCRSHVGGQEVGQARGRQRRQR